MLKKLRNAIYDFSIYNKMIFVAIVGAVLPMVILLSLFSWQIYREYSAKEVILAQSVADNIEILMTSYFEEVQKLSYTYYTDEYLEKTLNDGEGAIVEGDLVLEVVNDQIERDLLNYRNVRSIDLYYDTNNLSYESAYIHPIVALEDWYDLGRALPPYLFMTTEIQGGNVTIGLAKTLNSVDYNSQHLVHITLDGDAIGSLLKEQLLEAVEGEVYLLDGRNRVIASSEVVYSNNDMDYIRYSDLGIDEGETAYSAIGDKIYLKDWKLAYVLNRSAARADFIRQLLVIVVATLVVIGFVYLSHLLVTRAIVDRLKRINDSMTLAEEEIFVTINEDMGLDEVGETAGHYNKMIERIRGLVFIDPLTGAMNRQAIMDSLRQAIFSSDSREVALLFLDVDNFKFINDTYGHDIGDDVIRATAERLRHFEGSHLKLGRFGGDEFILVLTKDCQSDQIKTLGDGIRQAFAEPVTVASLKFFLTVSMGAVLSPSHGRDVHELIKKADMALYKAKELGRNRLAFFEEDMDVALEERFAFQNKVKEAFMNKEFYLDYQPYYTPSRQLVGYEALIRWYSKDYGQVSAYKLIDAVESMGLIVDLGKWILKEAMEFSVNVNKNRVRLLKVSVNISAIQLMNPKFYEDVKDIQGISGAKSSLMILEMTETILIKSLENSSKSLEALRDDGYGIAIDDFGTGYSSLKYLRTLPVTHLKIDRSFISTMDTNEVDKNLVETMTSLAHNMNLTVVAEGVEIQEQLEVASLCGCDIIQGYYFSKPLSETDALQVSEREEMS